MLTAEENELIPRFHSSQVAAEANGWRGQDTGYVSPEYDALYERYLVTGPLPERLQVLGDVARHIADQLLVLGLFYDTEPLAVKHRMQNVSAPKGGRVVGVASVFSAHRWDVK